VPQKSIIALFGEEYNHENCENCETASILKPNTMVRNLCYLFNCILEVKEKFIIRHIADILTGNATAAIKSYNHHFTDSFGIGSDESKNSGFRLSVMP
jgi:ATP-dependent DNA helicase RecQ